MEDDEEDRAHIETVVNVCGSQSSECMKDSALTGALVVGRGDTNL